MAGEKVVNYTPELTAKVLAMYAEGTSVDAIATAVGRTARSVIAKLSREGVYKAKGKAKGEGRVTKAEMVQMLAEKLGVGPERLTSLEKASHESLELLVESV